VSASLVKRLRAGIDTAVNGEPFVGAAELTMAEAANEIERLRALLLTVAGIRDNHERAGFVMKELRR
jgi:hypothetical protein